VRLVFEPKSKNQDQTEFMLMLLAHTSLESSNSINLVMIGGDGRPRQKGLNDICRNGSITASSQSAAAPNSSWARSTTASTSWKAGAVLLNIDKVIASSAIRMSRRRR
jgi:topoisomerase-4 subunit A